MIQRLTSPSHSEKQQPPEMLEFYKIFKTISKGPLQTLITTTMPVGNLDKATNLGEDTKVVFPDQTMEHVNSNMVVWDKHGATSCLTMARHMMTSVVNHE